MGWSLGRGEGLEGTALSGGRARNKALDEGASSYQVGFTTPSFQLTSSFRAVGARFSPSAHAGGGTSAEEMEALREAIGTRTMNLNAALNLDAGLIIASVTVFSTLLVVLNMLIDVMYAWLDPRISGAV